MWTVTLLLKPLIVVLHLLGGLTTLSLLAWLAMQPSRRPANARPRRPRLAHARAVGLVVLALQIMLGGWTSSNYAALACPDFPTCQNSLLAGHGREGCVRAVARAGHRLRRRRARPSSARRDPFRAPAGRDCSRRSCWALSFAGLAPRRDAAIRTAGAVLGIVLIAQLMLGPLMVVRALPLRSRPHITLSPRCCCWR